MIYTKLRYDIILSEVANSYFCITFDEMEEMKLILLELMINQTHTHCDTSWQKFVNIKICLQKSLLLSSERVLTHSQIKSFYVGQQIRCGIVEIQQLYFFCKEANIFILMPRQSTKKIVQKSVFCHPKGLIIFAGQFQYSKIQRKYIHMDYVEQQNIRLNRKWYFTDEICMVHCASKMISDIQFVCW